MPINDPTDIAGLVFWGDAGHVTENPSGQASAMDNREGTAAEDLAQTTESRRPTVTSVFGIAGLQFDKAASQYMWGGGSLPTVTNGTIIIVCRIPDLGSGSDVLLYARGAGGTTIVTLYVSNGGVYLQRADGVGDTVVASFDGDFAAGDDVVITLLNTTTGPVGTIRINGVQKATGATGITFGMDGVCIGDRYGLNPSDLLFYGVVTYNTILTGTDLTDIEDYMTTTYLPVNILTADAGADQSIVADESELGIVILDGSDSSGPLSITNFEWKEGAVVLQSGADPILILEGVSVAAHTYTLTVTDTNSDIDSDDVIKTVTVFVPPTPPTIRTYKTITTSTATVHNFSSVFPLTDPLVAPPFTEHCNQFRAFIKDTDGVVTELYPVGRPDDDGNTDFTINADGTGIVLDTALVATDTLLMMRDTQVNRAFVTLTNVAVFHSRDRNVRGDQILFVAQELREVRQIADILGSDSGDLFEYSPEPMNRSVFSRKYTGDGTTVAFSYSDIEMLPLEAVRHTPQLEVYIDDSLQSSGYTLSESTLLVTFSSAPADGELIELRRATRLDARWVQFADGTTFSSLQDEWDFLNIKFLVQETQDFPIWILSNELQNRLFARPINTLQYSGPGDRFYFGNLAWWGDGVVRVFKNDLKLIEGIDYTIDWNFFWILIDIEASDILDIITTTPNHAFGGLGFTIPNGKEDTDIEPVLPEVFRGTADTMISSSAPTTNFDENFYATFNNPALIPCVQFDVSDIDPADFSEIKLAYYVTAKISTLGVDVRIRRCLRTWDITTMTWNEYASGFPWAVAGAGGADSDYDSGSVITWLTEAPYPGVNSHWISPDISALVTEARADDGVLRLLMIPQSSPVLLHTVGQVDHPLASKHPQLITFL